MSNGISTSRGSIRRFFAMGFGFWGAERKVLAWLSSAALIFLTFGALGFQVALNTWNRDFFDALEQRDAARLFIELQSFLFIIAAGVLVAFCFVIARMSLQIRWREWMVRHLVSRWLNHAHAYQLEVVDGDHANPEFRLVTDVQRATESFIEFSIGFLSAILTASAFIGVLVVVGGGIDVPIGSGVVHIPAYMLIAAILYSGLATLLMFVLGQPLVGQTERKNQAEAELLYALTRTRENAEAIALGGGEARGRERIDQRVFEVVTQWMGLMRRQAQLTGVSSANGVLLGVVPLLLLAPRYVAGDMTLGQLMQLASAFSFVVVALNWFFDNFQKIAEWSASLNRVVHLLDAIVAAEAKSADTSRIRIERVEGEELRLKDVQVTLDSGRVVIGDADAVLRRGERVLIEGATGVGKSMLVRAIAGLWPWGSGLIEIPKGMKLMVLPQHAYLPTGTLKALATYPSAPEDIPDADVISALEKVGLGHRVGELANEEKWEAGLSEAEQQRFGFVRILLAKPDLLIIDEATSALDVTDELALFRTLREELPQTGLLTIGQHAELESVHDRKMTLALADGGAAAHLRPERARTVRQPTKPERSAPRTLASFFNLRPW